MLILLVMFGYICGYQMELKGADIVHTRWVNLGKRPSEEVVSYVTFSTGYRSWACTTDAVIQLVQIGQWWDDSFIQ